MSREAMNPYTHSLTRSATERFCKDANLAWTGRVAVSAVSGICGPDALGMVLGVAAELVVRTVQDYVKLNPRPYGCHISAEKWSNMAREGITVWKTDVDFFWVAALAFGVCVYVWSMEQGTKVFTSSGDHPRILSADEMRTKTSSSGDIIIAFHGCHYFAMMPEIILPLKVD